MKLADLLKFRRKKREQSDAEKLVEVTRLNKEIAAAREAYVAETENRIEAIRLPAEYSRLRWHARRS